ncbi:hypothetical protein MKW92_028178, partial [Papaver armeniacum]
MQTSKQRRWVDVVTSSAVKVGEVLPVADKQEISKQRRWTDVATSSAVKVLPETEEDFVAATSMLDLPASSHNAGVVAGVSVKAKSEGDSLSTTSTIEYGSDYTEEQYSTHTEDEVDEEYST